MGQDVDGPPGLSRGALAALAELGADPRADPTDEAIAELTAAGGVVAGLLTADAQPVARALAAPVGTLRLDHHTPAGARRIDGWVTHDTAVLAIPVAADRARLVVGPPGDLAGQLARLVGLGTPSGRDLPTVAPAHLGRGAPPQRVAVADLPSTVAPGGTHWRVQAVWHLDGEIIRRELGAIDDGTQLCLVDPVDDTDVEVGRTEASPLDALVRLVALQPSRPRSPARWRATFPLAGMRLEVPADWPLLDRGPGHVVFASSDVAAGDQMPATRVSVSVRDESAAAALERWAASLPDGQLLQRRRLELPHGEAEHEVALYLDPEASITRVGLAWAFARAHGGGLVTASVPTGALLSDLDTVGEIAARLRPSTSRPPVGVLTGRAPSAPGRTRGSEGTLPAPSAGDQDASR